MQKWNTWFGLSLQCAFAAWEAQNVIALRLMRLGAGGARAKSEAERMVTEKFAALIEAQGAVAAAALTGSSGHRTAKKVLGVYRKRVRKNRRRLAR